MFLYFVDFLIFVGYYYIEVKIMQSVTETEEYKQMQQSALDRKSTRLNSSH